MDQSSECIKAFIYELKVCLSTGEKMGELD